MVNENVLLRTTWVKAGYIGSGLHSFRSISERWLVQCTVLYIEAYLRLLLGQGSQRRSSFEVLSIF